MSEEGNLEERTRRRRWPPFGNLEDVEDTDDTHEHEGDNVDIFLVFSVELNNLGLVLQLAQHGDDWSERVL